MSVLDPAHAYGCMPTLAYENYEGREASHGSMFLPLHHPREKGKGTPPRSKSAVSPRTAGETVYDFDSYGLLHNIKVFAAERKAASSAVEREPQPTASTSPADFMSSCLDGVCLSA